jgi:general stress protein 26
MTDLRAKIAKHLAHPQLAGLATITADGKPWVRYVVITGDADLNLRVATFADSRKVAQAGANPEVHLICGATSLGAPSDYMQIEGRAEIVTDQAERHGLWTETLGAYFSGPDDPRYVVMVIRPHRIEYMTVGSKAPEVWEG